MDDRIVVSTCVTDVYGGAINAVTLTAAVDGNNIASIKVKMNDELSTCRIEEVAILDYCQRKLSEAIKQCLNQLSDHGITGITCVSDLDEITTELIHNCMPVSWPTFLS